MRGFITGVEPVDQMLEGDKTWEMRSKRTHIVGEEIGLIKKGTKAVYAIVVFGKSIGPLTLEELRQNADKHLPTPEEFQKGFGYKENWAWPIVSIRRLARPVPYKHPSGAQTWVTLPDNLLDGVESFPVCKAGKK